MSNPIPKFIIILNYYNVILEVQKYSKFMKNMLYKCCHMISFNNIRNMMGKLIKLSNLNL